MIDRCLLETSLPLPLFRRGKVRDVYEAGPGHLLMVATDRLSAFDVVMPNGIPGKGAVLTQLSRFWFENLAHVVPHHLVSCEVKDFPKEAQAHADALRHRSMLVCRTKPIEVECVVRGYLVGSGWKDYCKTGAVCGISLPVGLKEGCRFEAPLFTPAHKAHTGHDENISFAEMEKRLGAELAGKLRDISIRIYAEAATYAATRGFILVDTKFEFGLDEKGVVVWIDEALTPDSSRYWLAEDYKEGSPPPQGFDKQFVRNFLESSGWNKTPPVPVLPEDVVEKTRALYFAAYEKLTGGRLEA
jgi:phosphoribosylaminoimidazole-succinocarboxamide synthase